MSDFFVRTAGRNDLAAVSRLLSETWHATYDAIYGTDRVAEITAAWHGVDALAPRLERPDTEFVVADDGRRIAGMAFAALPASADGGRELAILHQIYIEPAFQRRGIGSALLAEIEASFFEARRLRVEVEDLNEPALAFYRARGFVRTAISASAVTTASMEAPASIYEKALGPGVRSV